MNFTFKAVIEKTENHIFTFVITVNILNGGESHTSLF